MRTNSREKRGAFHGHHHRSLPSLSKRSSRTQWSRSQWQTALSLPCLRTAKPREPHSPRLSTSSPGFIESRGRMGIEVILHDTNIFRLRIDLINQPADAVGVVDLAAMLRHLDMAPAPGGVDEEKQVGRAQPLILVIDVLCLPWFHRLWGPHVRLRATSFSSKQTLG